LIRTCSAVTIDFVTEISTTAAERLKASRLSLGLSQSKLARLSGVARFKICTFELGGGVLSPEDQQCIRTALEDEAARLRAAAVSFGQPESTEGV
jgi:transcriptional regulator with XRE-family HTH domain